MMLQDVIDAGATGAAAEAGPKFVEVVGRAGSEDFHVAIFGIADPAAEVEFAGFAVNKPPEADALHAAANEEVENHRMASLQKAGLGGVEGAVLKMSLRPGNS
jgi:hypothetical protein